jgi:hypothetical protein
MGSTGTGSFTDYPGSQGGRPGKNGGGGGAGGSGGSGGGKMPNDRCSIDLNGVSLQEVAICAYYKEHESPPPKKSRVRVRKKLLGGRIAVELHSTSEAVGLLPTKYNYIVACMKQGWEYTGNVVESTAAKLPKVIVNLEAKQAK